MNNEIVNNLWTALGYMNNSDEFNESSSALYVFEAIKHIQKLEENLKVASEALTRLRDCDWVISLPDRMDAVRGIAREALEKMKGE